MVEPNLAEAERRIEETRKSQAESLDLSNLALNKLPTSLKELSYLRALFLGNEYIDKTGKLHWHLRRNPNTLTDITMLAGLQGLQTLNLVECRGITDLSPLSSLRALQSLDLSITGLTDLSPLSGLQSLQSLDLSMTELTDLSPLSGLQTLQSLELNYCRRLTDLSPLSGLKALQSLELSNTELTDLSPLSGLRGLKNLDLHACRRLQDLLPLSGLQCLQSLSLWETELTDLSPLSGLQGLQNLYLWMTWVTDLSPLSGMHGLQSLSLSTTGVTDLSPLSSLQGLQRLDLSHTDVMDLSPLSGLQGLQYLYLARTELTDLSPLSGLQGLKELELSQTNVMDLSPLSSLQGLQSLLLKECLRLTDLSPLSVLQDLQNLDLSGSAVTNLFPLSGLQGLHTLDLSQTGVKDLSPLEGLQGLQSLKLWETRGVADLSPLKSLQGLQNINLSSTGVTDLSPLRSHHLLQSIDVSRTGVTDLSPLAELPEIQRLVLLESGTAPVKLLRVFAGQPSLCEVFVDKAIGVPQEVLSEAKHYGDNCLPRLRTYFSELDLGAEAENEVKVILLGNGRVGKTQLCRSFRGEPFNDSIPSTHGVQIWREELRFQAGGQKQSFQVNWWDFGGQDIYHGTHALFLNSRAVFLILWTPNLENRNEYSENGIPLRNQPLAYWLDYVRSLAGEGSPVIVVQSQCDRFADQSSELPRLDGLGWSQACSYSAKTDLGREVLEAQLREAIRYLLERNGALEIGRGRAEVRRQLYSWRSEDQDRKPEERQHRTLTLADFQALCDRTEGLLSWEHALDYFHHTGVLFYRPDLFSNRIILDQDWALDAVYAVFHRGRAVPWLRESGRFTREDLAVTIWQEHSLEEQTLFLGLMESCGVCFPCGRTSQGETRYVAPDLLPGFDVAEDRINLFWNEAPDTPTLRLEYRFFHPTIIRNLMSGVGQRAKNLGEYWKYGLWFKDGQRDSQLLVQFEDTSTDEAPGAGALELKAQGRDPLELLREIRKTIFWQRIGEEPQELLTLDGTTVARSALDTVMEGRVLDVEKRQVPATDFVAFFQERQLYSAEVREPGKTPEINISPQPLKENEKAKEIFISYAWGDDTPEGKVRDQVVDGLYTALEKDGFRPVRDRDQMHAGDRISAFISQLTRADLVVAVISEKYLRSTYCMFEIYRLWQRSQGDPDVLSKILVPLVLPEVKIKDVWERLPYIDYWRAEAERVGELERSGRVLSLSPETFQELRLVREFAHHVDGILVFIQDVLMPRKLEMHLDDGFQAVREAVRRRANF